MVDYDQCEWDSPSNVEYLKEGNSYDQKQKRHVTED